MLNPEVRTARLRVSSVWPANPAALAGSHSGLGAGRLLLTSMTRQPPSSKDSNQEPNFPGQVKGERAQQLTHSVEVDIIYSFPSQPRKSPLTPGPAWASQDSKVLATNERPES